MPDTISHRMLSLCILTKNSAGYIEKLLQGARAFADEIVIAVDRSSTDRTEKLCMEHADVLFRVEPVGNIERAQNWLYAQCNGDWILRVDDDELPSAGLVAALPRLTKDKEITHYWIPTRWMIGREEYRWIAQRPWWPDWHNRLFRNIPSIIQTSDRIHTAPHILGASRFFCDGCVYHMDLVYHTEEQRREKVARYEQISPGNSMSHYYLPDEGSLKTLPVPADDGPWIDSRSGRSTRLANLNSLKRQTNAAIKEVGLDEIRRAAMQECDYSQDFFKATLNAVDCPKKMDADQPCRVDLDLRNESIVAWASPGRGVPEVRISYHWLRDSREMYQYDGHRTVLPHVLQPGEMTRISSWVLPPRQSGRFILQWDLVVEQVSWFSNRGWPCPEFEVEVIEGES